MFIQTEATPNPNVVKFLPGRDVSPDRALEFRTIDEAQVSPLAEELLFGKLTKGGIVHVELDKEKDELAFQFEKPTKGQGSNDKVPALVE